MTDFQALCFLIGVVAVAIVAFGAFTLWITK